MAHILVSGLINIETTVKIDGFPLPYQPVRYPFFGVRSTVSGVGYNIAKALTTLGDDITFTSMIAGDAAGKLVHSTLQEANIPTQHVLNQLSATPQSAILYDDDGRRMINVDLKDIQEAAYPVATFDEALQGASIAVLCNINYNRPFLQRAQHANIPIATDVHTISNLDDDYNRDFMATATILFMSDEHLPIAPEEWAQSVIGRYHTPIVVIGLGAQGALLAIKDADFMQRFPARTVRPVVNTIGAGDALFSAFVHTYHHTRDPYMAIQKAIIFASYKIGVAGAAEGFLTADMLTAQYQQIMAQNQA